MAGGTQHVVGPERDPAIANLASEAHAFAHQARAEALPARLRLDEQHAQLGHRFGLSDEEHAANDLVVLLRQPTALVPRVEALHKLCRDARDKRLALHVPAVLLGIEHAVALDDPAQVARP
jgi:hypothetical protein